MHSSVKGPEGLFLESPGNFSGLKSCFMFDMFAFKITVSITCFENDALKLSVNEANFRGFRARNCATIEQVLILNFVFGPEKLPHLSRNVLLPPPPPPA